ncbi:hypothetical protein C8R31_103147 [Nitrosospira sp. Nsp2]|nr:hypothetical protein [Nitrosospira sp. Nsp2]PTR15562.1 hypothetical protein C8R31_103147 [Nitrosospira sp. Nsp2]
MAIDSQTICLLFNNGEVARVSLVLKKLIADATAFFACFLYMAQQNGPQLVIFSERAVILASTLALLLFSMLRLSSQILVEIRKPDPCRHVPWPRVHHPYSIATNFASAI